MAPWHEHTAKAILDLSTERDNFKQHAERLAKAINGFRRCAMLGKLTRLRGTDEYAELVAAWEAFQDEHQTGFVDDVFNVGELRNEWK